MNKVVVIILLFNSLLSQVTENKYLNRNNHLITNRQESILHINNNRDEDELLEFIESTMETHLIPGLSISVVKDDNIVWEKYFGYANIDENILVD